MNDGPYIFKVTAEDDVMYIQADSLSEAKERLKKFCGEIPESLLTWEPVPFESVPEGELL